MRDSSPRYYDYEDEEKRRRKKEWLIQQERERRHEKLKAQKIAEFERKRAEALRRQREEERRKAEDSSRRSRSHSPLKDGRKIVAQEYETEFKFIINFIILFFIKLLTKIDLVFRSKDNNFNDPEERKKIVVVIERNISNDDLERDVGQPEEIVINRRIGMF